MITIFATFRSFDHPHFGMIQRNAIGSWIRLEPRPQILVMGIDPGSKEICEEFGLTHVPDIKLSDRNTPMIDDMFAKAYELAVNETLLLVSSDIILFPDVLETASILNQHFGGGYMATLRRRDKHADRLIDFDDPSWADEARSGTTLGHPGAGDFFLFPKTFYANGIPPFAIGRASVDNWLIWEAVQLGACVDVTYAMQIVHQNHDYSHVGGFDKLVGGEEFKANRALGEGKMLEIINSNWVMGEDKVPRKR